MPGPNPRYWGPLAALVWIASRDNAKTDDARALEEACEARPMRLARFFADREIELAEHKRDGRKERFVDPAIPLLVLSRIDPSMQLAPKSAVEAVPALVAELANGARLRASGSANGDDARRPIPVHFWARATAHLLGTADHPFIAFADGKTVWTDVLLRMFDVKRCWQALGRGKQMPRRPTQAAVTDWYKQRVMKWPVGRPLPSIKDDWADARQELALEPSRDQIESARRDCAPREWKKRGRRRSSDLEFPDV